MIGTNGWIALVICMACNVTTHLAFKKMMQLPLDLSWHSAAGVITNPWTWIGLGGCLVFLLSYLFVLKSVPISVAYPVAVSMGMTGVVLSGVIIFGETLSFHSITGVILIMCGVLLVT